MCAIVKNSSIVYSFCCIMYNGGVGEKSLMMVVILCHYLCTTGVGVKILCTRCENSRSKLRFSRSFVLIFAS